MTFVCKDVIKLPGLEFCSWSIHLHSSILQIDRTVCLVSVIYCWWEWQWLQIWWYASSTVTLILTTLYYENIVCFITVLIVGAGENNPHKKTLSLLKAVFYLAIRAFTRSYIGCRQTSELNSSV